MLLWIWALELMELPQESFTTHFLWLLHIITCVECARLTLELPQQYQWESGMIRTEPSQPNWTITLILRHTVVNIVTFNILACISLSSVTADAWHCLAIDYSTHRLLSMFYAFPPYPCVSWSWINAHFLLCFHCDQSCCYLALSLSKPYRPPSMLLIQIDSIIYNTHSLSIFFYRNDWHQPQKGHKDPVQARDGNHSYFERLALDFRMAYQNM